jgi:RHS repeat-associated protein
VAALVTFGAANATALQESLAYDGSGELVQRYFPAATIGERSRFFLGEHADVSVSTTGVVTATVNVLRNGLRVAHWAGGSTMVYYHRDRLGSVVATTMNGGGFGVQYRYLPYGAIDKNVVTNANGASELKFTGARDLYGGLLHLRSRVYSPTIRRFLQADSVDLLRYSYVMGDPVNFVDPSGHSRTSSGDEFARGRLSNRLWDNGMGFSNNWASLGGSRACGWSCSVLAQDRSYMPREAERGGRESGSGDGAPSGPPPPPPEPLPTRESTQAADSESNVAAEDDEEGTPEFGFFTSNGGFVLVSGSANIEEVKQDSPVIQELKAGGPQEGEILLILNVTPTSFTSADGKKVQPAGEVIPVNGGSAIIIDPGFVTSTVGADGVYFEPETQKFEKWKDPTYTQTRGSLIDHELTHYLHPERKEKDILKDLAPPPCCGMDLRQ